MFHFITPDEPGAERRLGPGAERRGEPSDSTDLLAAVHFRFRGDANTELSIA